MLNKKYEYITQTKFRVYVMNGGHIEQPTVLNHGRYDEVFYHDFGSVKEAEDEITAMENMVEEFIVLPVIKKYIKLQR